jgi:erythromycin esterase
MIQGGTATWNIRDEHMMDTLTRLMEFHGKNSAKSIVWAHNTHIGDARYTDMAQANMVNLGQLVRQQASQEKALLVGFGTYSGTVIAAREWGERMEKMNVPPAVQGSCDNIIHNLSDGRNSLLVFRKNKSEEYTKEEYLINEAPEEKLRAEKKRGQRAIGVVYNPEHERYGNYVPTILIDRYDAFIYLDKSNAIYPLHMPTESGEVKETFKRLFLQDYDCLH